MTTSLSVQVEYTNCPNKLLWLTIKHSGQISDRYSTKFIKKMTDLLYCGLCPLDSNFVTIINDEGDYLEEEEEEINPTPIASPVKYPLSLLNKPKLIVGGKHHLLLLTINGELYGCGKNRNFQLGHSQLQLTETSGIDNNYTSKFIRLDFPGHLISKIWCGDYFTLIKTIYDDFYFTGSLNFKDNLVFKEFTNINNLLFNKYNNIINEIKEIICNRKYLSIITNKGELFSCGNNELGQLGIENQSSNFLTFEKVKLSNNFSERIIDIKFGKNHSIILSDNNRIYTTGENTVGQLGTGDKFNLEKYENIYYMRKYIIKQIGSGNNLSILLTNENEVFISGYCTNHVNEKNYFFTKLFIPPFLKIASVGAYFSNVAIFTLDSNKCYISGENNYGEIGIGFCGKSRFFAKLFGSGEDDCMVVCKACDKVENHVIFGDTYIIYWNDDCCKSDDERQDMILFKKQLFCKMEEKFIDLEVKVY